MFVCGGENWSHEWSVAGDREKENQNRLKGGHEVLQQRHNFYFVATFSTTPGLTQFCKGRFRITIRMQKIES